MFNYHILGPHITDLFAPKGLRICFDGVGILFEDTEEKQNLGLHLNRQSAIGHTFERPKNILKMARIKNVNMNNEYS